MKEIIKAFQKRLYSELSVLTLSFKTITLCNSRKRLSFAITCYCLVFRIWDLGFLLVYLTYLRNININEHPHSKLWGINTENGFSPCHSSFWLVQNLSEKDSRQAGMTTRNDNYLYPEAELRGIL